MIKYWQDNLARMMQLTVEHAQMVLIALIIAFLVAIVLIALFLRKKNWMNSLIYFFSLLYSVPSYAFFALLTLHKVKSLRINPDDSGGNMSFEGGGNWLIIIAPYFFPLFGLLTMIGISIYTLFAPMNLILNGLMGFVIGYHIDTVASQIHEKQTDLPKVGYYFCAVFLLPANLWMIGSMMAFNSKGWEGIIIYQKLITQLNGRHWDYIMNFLGL